MKLKYATSIEKSTVFKTMWEVDKFLPILDSYNLKAQAVSYKDGFVFLFEDGNLLTVKK